jgi:hypothetical protein
MPTQNVHSVGTCKHLLPFLEEALFRGGSITSIEQGYSEVRQVIRLSHAPTFALTQGALSLPEALEYFEANDTHYHPVPEAGLLCSECRQVIAWDKE